MNTKRVATETRETPTGVAKTDAEAIALLGISAQAFSEWRKSPDFPAKKNARGWPMDALYDYQALRLARDKRTLAGENVDRKARKLDVEIEILELRRDEIRRELIPMQEHLAEITEAVGILRWGAEQFPALTAADGGGAEDVARATRVRDRVLARVRERFAQCDEKQ